MFAFGNTLTLDQANVVESWEEIHHYNSGAKPTRGGAFLPNRFGLCDMHGNLGEWCSDWYQVDYYSQSPKVDPTGPDYNRYKNKTGLKKVVRGGYYLNRANECRSSIRESREKDDTSHLEMTGFRVVCEE